MHLVPFACFAGLASASFEESRMLTVASIEAMEGVFLRSDMTHKKSMEAIAKTLTTSEKALAVLEQKIHLVNHMCWLLGCVPDLAPGP